MTNAVEIRSRLVLRANAAFSTVTGLIAVLAPRWVSEVSGIDPVWIVRLGGVGLLVFAADVVRQSLLADDRLGAALLQTSIADFGWVVATFALVPVVDFTQAGLIGAMIVAALVADFGVAQLWLRSRLAGEARRDGQPTLAER